MEDSSVRQRSDHIYRIQQNVMLLYHRIQVPVTICNKPVGIVHTIPGRGRRLESEKHTLV